MAPRWHRLHQKKSVLSSKHGYSYVKRPDGTGWHRDGTGPFFENKKKRILSEISKYLNVKRAMASDGIA